MISQKEKQKRTQERTAAATKESTSIRLSQNDRDIIQKKADAAGMKMTEYVRDCALHGSESVSPYAKMKLQNLINAAYEQIRETDPVRAQALLEEVKDVWTL